MSCKIMTDPPAGGSSVCIDVTWWLLMSSAYRCTRMLHAPAVIRRALGAAAQRGSKTRALDAAKHGGGGQTRGRNEQPNTSGCCVP
jgi:hypothetical protein